MFMASVRGGLLAIFLAGSLLSVAVALPLAPGSIQPNFTLPKFNTSQQVDFYNDLAGKITVFDFFAYWCGPCMTASSELEPQVQQYYAALGGNPSHIPVQLVSVNIQGNAVSQTQSYISTYGLEYVLDDPSWNLYNFYSTGYIPQFAIVNGATNTNKKQWEVAWTQTGYSAGNYTAFRSQIDSIKITPEPSTWFLLISGSVSLVAWCAVRRRVPARDSNAIRPQA
jgi:thiol-disulfide isomerase/thioredoxin